MALGAPVAVRARQRGQKMTPPITGEVKPENGAGDGDRTHDIQLGKLTFYH